MNRLNIVHGKSKGWIKSAREASLELDINLNDAKKDFDYQITKLPTNNKLIKPRLFFN